MGLYKHVSVLVPKSRLRLTSNLGLYLVLVKPLLNKYHPITILLYLFGFGVLYIIPFGYNSLTDIKWGGMPNIVYLKIAFVVIFTTFVAYLLNSSALKQLSPTTVSIYIYLQPILATMFAIFWGADSLDNQKIIAALLIFMGVYLVSNTSFKQKKEKLS